MAAEDDAVAAWVGFDSTLEHHGELEAAADDGAAHHGDRRDLAELDRIEGLVPALGMRGDVARGARDVFGEIEARAKMVAGGVEHDRAHVGRAGEETVQLRDGRIVEGVAFGRPVEPEPGDRTLDRDVDADGVLRHFS